MERQHPVRCILRIASDTHSDYVSYPLNGRARCSYHGVGYAQSVLQRTGSNGYCICSSYKHGHRLWRSGRVNIDMIYN